MKLSYIAKIIDVKFDGEDIEIDSMNTLQDATSSELSFVANKKYIKDIATSKAGAILVDEANKDKVPSGTVALVVDDTYWKMAILSKEFAPKIESDEKKAPIIGSNSKISSKAELASGVVIGSNVYIMAGVYLGDNVEIGDNTILYPNVVVYRDCKIGNFCTIHAGTVIGSDGFGFASNHLGEHQKIYHNGNAIIEDSVDIGANSTVDRAVFGSTIIRKGVRIDNLVQIGHNCDIGEGSVIVSQSGVAGSSKIGRNNVLGAQSGVAGHLEVAPFNTFAARTGITKSIKESGQTFAGFPFMQHKKWLKIQAKIAKLIQ